MTAQSGEMADVVRHHHRNAGRARDLGDMRVVDPPTDEAVACRGVKKRSAVIVWELANVESAQDLFLNEPQRVGRREPHLHWYRRTPATALPRPAITFLGDEIGEVQARQLRGRHRRSCDEPLADSDEPRAWNASVEPDGDVVHDHFELRPGLEAGFLTDRRRDDHPACLIS